MVHGNRTGSSESGARRIDVIVVGAGFAGMYATYKFRQMGKSVVGIEAGGDLGGVWYWNRYPGARCDLMSVDYSYGFSQEIEQEWTWWEQFAAQPEILAYINFVADKFELRRSYLFNTRVTSAIWDENAKIWRVTTDRGRNLRGALLRHGDRAAVDSEGSRHPRHRAVQGQAAARAEMAARAGQLRGQARGCHRHRIDRHPDRAGGRPAGRRALCFSAHAKLHDADAQRVARARLHGRDEAPLPRHARGHAQQPDRRHPAATTRPFFSVPPAQRRQALEHAWKNGGLACSAPSPTC